MNSLSKTFFTGLATILPIAVTLYVLWWLGSRAESLASSLLERLFPGVEYWPGVGIVLGFAVVFLVGILMRAYIVRTLFSWGETILGHIPLVKTLYGSLRDLTGFFAAADEREMNQAVMVRLGDSGVRLLGLLTREDFSDLPAGVGGDDTVAVYLPMSYQLGGFTTMVPRSFVEPVDFSMEDAMRFAVTAGLSGGKESPASAGRS